LTISENLGDLVDSLAELTVLDTLTLWDLRYKFETSRSPIVRHLGTELIDTMIGYLKGLESAGISIKKNFNALLLSGIRTVPKILSQDNLSLNTLLELLDPIQASEYLKGTQTYLNSLLYLNATKLLSTFKETLVNLYKVKREAAHRITRDLLKSLNELPTDKAILVLLLVSTVNLGLLLRLTR